MGSYSKAPDDVVELVVELIDLYHNHLTDARIGLLMRDEAPVSAGMATLGQARKISPEHRAFMDYDFVIWFAQDEWNQMTTLQRRALADHELCHCWKWRGKVSMRRHDFEEFNCIIERYGFWRPSGKGTEYAVQARLGFERDRGRVVAVEVGNQKHDWLDDVADMVAEGEKA